ncbi:MAG TPA: DCC1-like thiol-disulfide oxidoreductase family protein [Polyangiaceae bacterium]|nr:DCC1-like thiol-disulfide oxidoreductase family protein [Polyangiaceae bacterium]
MDSKDKPEAASSEDGEVESAGDEAEAEEEAARDPEASAPPPTVPASTPSRLSQLLELLNERYRSIDPRWLGLFRICFGVLLITELAYRWASARLLFSNDGLLPNHYSLFAPMGQDLFSIYHVFSTIEEVHVAFALTLVVFVCFTLGYKTRLFHILSALLITSLHSRNLFTENGGSVVTHSLAIWTVFLPLGQCFSVDAVLRSWHQQPEHSPAALNRRETAAPPRFISLVVLGLLLQWSVIYFFNCVHKTGAGWKDNSAIYWFLYQDRIVTQVGVWAREHVPLVVLQVLTRMTLLVEGTLAFILLVPFGQKQLRRIAFLLALGLHGSIALLSRLGPFSYAMAVFFLMLFGEEELGWLGRWFGRKARAVTIVFDADCGICLWLCRLLKRLDPWQRITFIGNDETERLPAGVDPKLVERSVVVVDGQGRIHVEEQAVRRGARALPLGILLVWWLYVPGLSLLGRSLYRWVARSRLEISSFFGLGACGTPLAHAAPPASTPLLGRMGDELRSMRVVGRETLIVMLMVVLSTEVAKANPFMNRRMRIQRPEWMTQIIGYTRMLEGWGMFAPEPPYDDGRLVVDGRTVDGKKLDPFTGEEPEFDPESPRGWGHDQLWCDYSNHIRWQHNAGRRQFLRSYLVNQHLYSGRPQDQLASFDVWWIQDKSPKPGQKRGVPLPPEKLVSYGLVKDSGAKRWLGKAGSEGARR